MNSAVVIVWALTARRFSEPQPKSLDDMHVVQLYTTQKSCSEDLADFRMNPTPKGPQFSCVLLEVADISVHEDARRRSQK